MELISTNASLRNNLSRLVREYENISFAVAWASAGTEIFQVLRTHPCRIHKAIIGTHFYQTHPDVLDAFVGANNVRFILQPKGVFHPKIYIFWDQNHWEVLMGSANPTAGAMTDNAEAMVLISDRDQPTSQLKNDVLALIDSYWNKARSINNTEALAYRALWKKQQPALLRLSGLYGQTTNSKTPLDSKVMGMSWTEFLNSVNHDRYHGLQNRCELLKLVRNAFNTTCQFNNMELGLRKTIAGLPNDFNERWGWFGSMKGAGYYHQAVNNNNLNISKALDEIPLTGKILREHYKAYLARFICAFPNGGHGIGVASRLLALKRPDYFVCFDLTCPLPAVPR